MELNSFFFKEEGRGVLFTSPLLYALPVSSLTIRVKGRAGGGATVGCGDIPFSQQYTSPAHIPLKLPLKPSEMPQDSLINEKGGVT